MLPLGTSAATTEDQAIRTQIKNVYRKVQHMVGWNLSGLCGLMTDYQLYYLGVDTTLKISDGNGQYDEYRNLDMTYNGYKVTRYPAENYTLEEALYTMTEGGTRNVYNVLVGFQWTNTSAGARYGHACVIHAILDGKVYFVEGFWTPFGAAGNALVCSISEFANYYNSWTRFEGAVEFGNKDYSDFCQQYPANLFVKTTAQTQIIPQLSDVDNAQAQVLRQVAAGERLHVTALYKNTLGQYYYQVTDGGATGYIPAENTQLVQFDYEDIQLTGLAVPGALKLKNDFNMAGTLAGVHSTISGLEVVITDASGNEVQSSKLEMLTRMRSLSNSTLNKAINYAKLAAGSYTYTVNAYVQNNYLDNGVLTTDDTKLVMHSSVFTVGGASADTIQPPVHEPGEAKNGWKWENGAWYFYENDVKRTGWICDDGVDYYLHEDGAAATGWTEINGKNRFFSETGAMRTGWLQTTDGLYYMLSNGVAAQGWKDIDGQKYYFDQQGNMKRSSWITEGENRYYVLADGTMATGWVELPEGSKCFLEDGRLYAEVCKEGNLQYIRFYGESVTDEMPQIGNVQLDVLVK